MLTQRGLFIVLEGLDRSGKSTQVERVTTWLNENGKNAKVARFPGSDRTTAIGQMINAYLTSSSDLSDEVIHLLFSANRWERAKEIERDLLAGTSIVCDRYAFSGVAFTAAKGLDFDWCKNPDEGLLQPDIVFFLDIPTSIAEQRGGYGQERYERKDFQAKVRDVFLTMPANLPPALWHNVDASPSLEHVTNSIVSSLEPLLSETALSDPAWKLWQDR